MTRVTLLTGANLGDPREQLRMAYREIEQRIGPVVRRSSVHVSEAWGFESENEFYNQALQVETDLTPEELLKTIWAIESRLGKPRGTEAEELARKEKIEKGESSYTSRLIDIDILFYGDAVIRTELLTIPHKLIEAREFVLRPLCEFMGDYLHPVSGKPLKALLNELEGSR